MKPNQFSTKIINSALVGLSVSAIAAIAPAVRAVEFPDGTVAFDRPPEFVEVDVNHNCVSMPADYFFTLQVPENGGEPVQRLTISQEEGLEEIDFNVEVTAACESERKGEPIAIADVTRDPNGRNLSIAFERPIQPGETAIVRLHADRNPQTDGIYLFGVTAFPEGDRVRGQFLGFKRLQLTAD